MMKTINRLFLAMVTVMLTAITASAASHWTCDTHAFQYDMTAYVQLTDGGFPLIDYSDYEIAAFVEDECRGIARILNAETPFGLIRIRSNEAFGEVVTFKVYRFSTFEEISIDDVSIEFTSQGIEGLPSSPLLLEFTHRLMGDVDGDDRVTIADVVTLIDYLIDDSTLINNDKADVDGDGNIGIADVVTLIDYILSH